MVVALFRVGADVRMMELPVCGYERLMLEEEREIDSRQPVRNHSILPPTSRSIAFRCEALRDELITV